MLKNIEVQKRQWKEPREHGWSETTYTGLFFPKIGPNGLIVSKLSHGLRVIEVRDPEKYHVLSSVQITGISQDSWKKFLQEAQAALEADKKFQLQIGFYEETIV